MIKSKKRKNWFLWLRISGILLFVYVLFNYDLTSIWGYMKKIDPLFFILALIAQFFLLMLKSVRWHIMNNAENSRIAIMQSFGEFLESYAMGVITPGRLGELTKAGYQKEKANIFIAIFRVLFERGLDVGLFVIIAGSAIVWGQLVKLNFLWPEIILISGVGIFLFTIALLSMEYLIISLKKIFRVKTLEFQHYKVGKVFLIVFFSLGSNFFAFLSPFFLILGLPLVMDFLTTSGGVAIAGLFNMLPITVMGLGTREMTFLYVYQQFSESQIMAFSGLIFVTAQVGGGVMALGLGELLLFFVRKTKS